MTRRKAPPVNKAEREFYDAATANGWTLSKRGWPDFFCTHPDGRVILVEVKPLKREALKRDQAMVMRHLADLGADCYRWSPSGGFQKVHPNTPQTVLVSGRERKLMAQKDHPGVARTIKN